MSLIYCRKSAERRMEPRGTPALTGYSCEDFPFRTIWDCLLLRHDEIRSKFWPETPKNLNLWRRSACQILSKAYISRATVWVVPDLLKALAIISDTIIRRSAVDWEDLKPYWKSEKNKTTFFPWSSSKFSYLF